MGVFGQTLNTCHGIKGEEFHTVIAFGLLDGLVPHWSDPDKITASRKLLYVICSRAKKHLHLISERNRPNKREITEHLRLYNYSYDSD
ncbi:MAG: ATP-binding domain-containing protein [Prevotellaceae bacterium]|nr:ATP-binding domain-containing protein [Prevotellaceae bacterium]